MPAFIRTPEDERLWAEAKQQVGEEYGSEEDLGKERYWSLVNGIFQRMKSGAGGGELKKAYVVFGAVRQPEMNSLRKAVAVLEAEADAEEAAAHLATHPRALVVFGATGALVKSHVKAHTRKLASGNVTHVRAHEDKRTRKPRVTAGGRSGAQVGGGATIREPFRESLLEIVGAYGPTYSYIQVSDSTRHDADKLLDAMRDGDRETVEKLAVKHQSQIDKGAVQGGPKEVKVGDATRSTIARAALGWLHDHPEPTVVDFSTDPQWDDIAYQEATPEAVARLAAWLKENPDAIVRLYHGTAAKHDILQGGIKPTSSARRNSLQSSSGMVSLSIYPGMAHSFGKMAYPRDEIAVYAVDIPVRMLRSDNDQLRNQRLFAERKVGDSLAESIAYGHGAQVKGTISATAVANSGPLAGKLVIVPVHSDKRAAAAVVGQQGMFEGEVVAKPAPPKPTKAERAMQKIGAMFAPSAEQVAERDKSIAKKQALLTGDIDAFHEHGSADTSEEKSRALIFALSPGHVDPCELSDAAIAHYIVVAETRVRQGEQQRPLPKDPFMRKLREDALARGDKSFDRDLKDAERVLSILKTEQQKRELSKALAHHRAAVRQSAKTGKFGTVAAHTQRHPDAKRKLSKEPKPKGEGKLMTLSLAEVEPDPHQHRKSFPQSYIDELAGSIKETGLKQPITVYPHKGPGGIKYRIIAGECRYRASTQLGLPKIKAFVRIGATEQDILTEQVAENITRKQVTPMEEAVAYRQLADLFIKQAKKGKRFAGKDLKDPAVAARLEDAAREFVSKQTGKGQHHVTFYIKLNELAPEVQAFVSEGRLSPRHGNILTQLTNNLPEDTGEPQAEEAAGLGQLFAAPRSITKKDRLRDQVRLARHAVAHQTTAEVLQQMVTQYIRDQEQQEMFGAEEMTGGEKMAERRGQKAKIDKLVTVMADLIDETFSKDRQDFRPEVLSDGELQINAFKVNGAIKTLGEIMDIMQAEMVKRETTQATKRRTGENVGESLFAAMGKSLAAMEARRDLLLGEVEGRLEKSRRVSAVSSLEAQLTKAIHARSH